MKLWRNQELKYKVEFTKSAIKDLKKIDKKDSTKIAAWIKKNLVDCENPRRYGKVLKGNLSDSWRFCRIYRNRMTNSSKHIYIWKS